MDINEARQVLWPDKYHRPMGELLDIGFLYKRKLTWAAEHALDARVREAAKLFGDSLPAKRPGQQPRSVSTPPKAFDVGISLERARTKPWPFSPYNSQLMGELVESKQLTMRDLGYAIDTARDESVRRSAMALMLERLDQLLKEPPPANGSVEVVSGGRSYALQRQSRFTFFQGMLAGFLVGFAVMMVILLVRSILTPRPAGPSFAEFVSTSTGAIAFGIVVAFMLLTIVGMMVIPEVPDRRFQRKVDEARLGQEGEQRVADLLLQALDGSWKVFRNLRLPGGDGDLDFVLVGPPGVWALEVKNLNGDFRNVGNRWDYRAGNTWKTALAQPSQQARRKAGHLGGFLKADGLKVFAEPAVVWANPESPLTVEDPTVPVWTLERLPDELGNIWYSKQMAAATREQIIQKLTRQCDRQRSRDQEAKAKAP